MDTDGGNIRRLIHDPARDLQPEVPAWSPIGGQIAFQSTGETNSTIYVMNVNGSDIRQLTNVPNFGPDKGSPWLPIR